MIARILVKIVLLGVTIGAWGGLILLAAGIGLQHSLGSGLAVAADVVAFFIIVGILHSLWQDYQRLRTKPPPE